MRLTEEAYLSYTNYKLNARCIAASGDTVHVVWFDNREVDSAHVFQIYYKRSVDNGKTWGPDTKLSNHLDEAKLPSVAATGSNVYVFWVGDDGDDDYYYHYYRRSVDNGETWEAPELLTSQRTYYPTTPAVVACDNHVHVMFHGYRYLYYKHSSDFGRTWGNNKTICNLQYFCFNEPSMAVYDHGIHVVWTAGAMPGAIYYSTSMNYGGTWSEPVMVSDSSDRSQAPSVAAYEDNVYVIWYEYNSSNPYRKYDMCYNRSTCNGMIWKNPEIFLLHSTLKCNTKVSDFEGCFEAQALPGSVIKP